MSRRFSCALCLCCLALVYAVATPASAGTWQGPPGQTASWFNYLNWNGLPMNSGGGIENGGCAEIAAGTATAYELVLGTTAGSGSLSVIGGQLSVFSGDFTVGSSGYGAVSHTAGSVTVTGSYSGNRSLSLGRYVSAIGTYSLTGTGSLVAPNESIGSNGTGVFSQSGPSSNRIYNTLTVGGGGSSYNGTGGGTGSYSLSDTAVLTAATLTLGDGSQSTGTFVQRGGSVTLGSSGSSGYLYLAYSSSSVATYTLSGGNLFSGTQHVGRAGRADFTHDGGTNNLGSATLSLAGSSGYAGNATYTLSGSATLIAGAVDVGTYGTAVFRQSGGTASIGSLTVGAGGRSEFTGGTLQTTSVTNAGTLVLANPAAFMSLPRLTNTGTLAVDAGNVSTRTAGLTGTGSTAVAAAARLSTASVRQSDLSVAGTVTLTGTAPSSLATLLIAPTGLLDLGLSPLAVNYAAASPAAAVRSYLRAARGPDAAWSGTTGLTSAAAAADPLRRLALAYAEASDLGLTTFHGLAVDATTLVIDLAPYGDADLDGTLAPDDFARLDRGYAMRLAGWSNGDFDYSGTIDRADYLLADRSFAIQQAALPPDLLAAREAQFGPTYVAELLASVPEPGTGASLLAAALFPCFRRSRRRR